jgi:hypothetical protein
MIRMKYPGTKRRVTKKSPLISNNLCHPCFDSTLACSCVSFSLPSTTRFSTPPYQSYTTVATTTTAAAAAV